MTKTIEGNNFVGIEVTVEENNPYSGLKNVMSILHLHSMCGKQMKVMILCPIFYVFYYTMFDVYDVFALV